MPSFKRVLGLAILALLTTVLLVLWQSIAPASPSEPAPPILPNRAHPLPDSLARWHDRSQSGDYFAEVKPTRAGYLVWSKFPVRVYVEPPEMPRSRQWMDAALGAIEDWNAYLPLEVTERRDRADIQILSEAPPLQRNQDGTLRRARSAETRYELYVRHDESANRAMLVQKFVIAINPTQTGDYARSALRHELGHALGIWGHSENPDDAMYFSQRRHPAPISPRDINTLERIYRQPTRLGWWVSLENSGDRAN